MTGFIFDVHVKAILQRWGHFALDHGSLLPRTCHGQTSITTRWSPWFSGEIHTGNSEIHMKQLQLAGKIIWIAVVLAQGLHCSPGWNIFPKEHPLLGQSGNMCCFLWVLKQITCDFVSLKHKNNTSISPAQGESKLWTLDGYCSFRHDQKRTSGLGVIPLCGMDSLIFPRHHSGLPLVVTNGLLWKAIIFNRKLMYKGVSSIMAIYI